MNFIPSFLAGVLLVGTGSYTIYSTISRDTMHIQHRLMDIQRQLYGQNPSLRKNPLDPTTELAMETVDEITTGASRYVSKWAVLVSQKVHEHQHSWNEGVRSLAEQINKGIGA